MKRQRRVAVGGAVCFPRCRRRRAAFLQGGHRSSAAADGAALSRFRFPQQPAQHVKSTVSETKTKTARLSWVIALEMAPRILFLNVLIYIFVKYNYQFDILKMQEKLPEKLFLVFFRKILFMKVCIFKIYT